MMPRPDLSSDCWQTELREILSRTYVRRCSVARPAVNVQCESGDHLPAVLQDAVSPVQKSPIRRLTRDEVKCGPNLIQRLID